MSSSIKQQQQQQQDGFARYPLKMLLWLFIRTFENFRDHSTVAYRARHTTGLKGSLGLASLSHMYRPNAATNTSGFCLGAEGIEK
ncbi:hypothetical protein PoB_000545600 [Plakobranchus ocellatus]|uniref:Uncharacterized protein n=1 Tax=Plakobranchus ocellatus TaxID=259542 RepID=A0AAV3XVC3_9GAST|nr:hypothetical protein PoB_000545600 [Plakobranchus ocellatus]